MTYCSKLVETTGKLRVGEDQYTESLDLLSELLIEGRIKAEMQ